MIGYQSRYCHTTLADSARHGNLEHPLLKLGQTHNCRNVVVMLTRYPNQIGQNNLEKKQHCMKASIGRPERGPKAETEVAKEDLTFEIRNSVACLSQSDSNHPALAKNSLVFVDLPREE